MLSGVYLTILQLQFINITRLKLVISILKQILTEDFGSKSQLILIAWIKVSGDFEILGWKASAANLG
jgi:hypothetical protein